MNVLFVSSEVAPFAKTGGLGDVAAALPKALAAKGHDVRDFLSESRFELRKVVWPTRQETTRMTWVVIAVVIILSLILAGFDFVVQKAIQWFLGR